MIDQLYRISNILLRLDEQFTMPLLSAEEINEQKNAFLSFKTNYEKLLLLIEIGKKEKTLNTATLRKINASIPPLLSYLSTLHAFLVSFSRRHSSYLESEHQQFLSS